MLSRRDALILAAAAGAANMTSPARADNHIVMTGQMGNIGQRIFPMLPGAVGIDKKMGYAWDLTSEGPKAVWREAIGGARVVIHLATGYGDGKIDEPRKYDDPLINLNLLQACLTNGVSRIVFATSTWACPGRYRPGDWTGKPLSPYGDAKHAMETALRFYANAGLISAISVRIGWAPPDSTPTKDAFAESIRNRTSDLFAAFSRAVEPAQGYAELDVNPLHPI